MKKKFNINYVLIPVFIIFFFLFPNIKGSLSNKEGNIDYSIAENVLINTYSGKNFFFKTFDNIKIYFLSKKYLYKNINDLEMQIQSLKYNNILISSSSQDLEEKNNNIPILTKKIFSDFTYIYDTVLINKGFLNNIEKGDIVFIYPNHIIGEIENINPKTSLVSLYSKNGNKIQGILNVYKDDSILINKDISNSSSSSSTNQISADSLSKISIENSLVKKYNNIIIEVEGMGSGDFISSIPDSIMVSTGTIVYLAYDNTKSIGEVIKVEDNEASFYKKLFIRGFYNSASDDDYYVMHKYK